MAISLVGSSVNSVGGTGTNSVYTTYAGQLYSSTTGNMLVVVASYDVAAVTDAQTPFMTPADSASNIYIPLGQLPSGLANSTSTRLAVFACPNARAIKWVSAAPATIVSAQIVGVYEFSGAPAWAELSMTTVYASATGTAISVSGPANSASFAIGIAATSTTTATWTGPAGWTTEALTPTGATNGVNMSMSFMSTGGSGTITYAPTLSVSSPYSACLAAITLSPVAPVQVNSSAPRFIVEAQFGRDLGDLTNAPYSPGAPAGVLFESFTPAATSFSATYITTGATFGGGGTLALSIVVPAAATITAQDNAGNVYTPVGSPITIPGGGVGYTFQCLRNVAILDQTIITITQSVSQTMLAVVYGIPGVWQLDVQAQATGTSTTPSVATGALGSPLDFEMVFVVNNSTTHLGSGPAAYSYLSATASGSLVTDIFSRNSTPGAGFNVNGAGDTFTATYGGSIGWGAMVVAWKAVQWVDISSYAVADAGAEVWSTVQGQPYELSQPEAGTLNIQLDNHLGNFTPTNTSSPFYPGVLAEVPVRVTAIWNGRQYPCASGYVDQWPIEWPELPQWGFTKVTATDSIELLTNSSLQSGYACEVRNDNPYVYLPGNEQYSTNSSTLQFTSTGPSFNTTAFNNQLKQAAEAAGLPVQNQSLVNQRNGFYSDGGEIGLTGGAFAQTGMTMNMTGSSDTGFGNGNYATSASSSYTPAGPRGPGITYVDPFNLPSAAFMPGGVTLEWVCQVPGTSNAGTPVFQNVTLFEALTEPSSFATIAGTPGPADLVIFTNAIGTGAGAPSNTSMYFYANSGSSQTPLQAAANPYIPTTTANGTTSANLFHVVVKLTGTTIEGWINGVQTLAPTAFVCRGNWVEFRLGGARGRAGSPARLYNYTMGHFALYSYLLPAARIYAHAQMAVGTGLPLTANTETVSSFDYMAAACAYSRVPLNAAGPGSAAQADTGQMGSMYSLNNSSTMDAINTAITSESGMVYSDPQCNTVLIGRNLTYNQPSFTTFGDNGTSQIPFLQNMVFGYDDQFIYTEASTSQQTGSTTGITATAQNAGGNGTGSIVYGHRNAPAATVQVQQANDAIDRTNWVLNKFTQAQIRGKTITVDAMSLIGGTIDTSLSATGGIIGTLLSCIRGTVVNVQRNQMGGAPISELAIIEQREIVSGPSLLQFQFVISPYVPDGDILQADVTNAGSSGQPVNQLGYGSLAW